MKKITKFFLLLVFNLLFFLFIGQEAEAAVKIRQEINILNSTLNVMGSASTSAEKVLLDTSKYSGSMTYYFELVAYNTNPSTKTVSLRRAGTTTDDATITLTAGGSSYARFRSDSFTPPTGQTTYVVYFNMSGGGNIYCKAARIIIIQNAGSSLTGTQTQIEIGNLESGKTNGSSSSLNSPKYWTYTAGNWDGTKTFSAEVSYRTGSTVGGTFGGTNAGSSTTTMGSSAHVLSRYTLAVDATVSKLTASVDGGGNTAAQNCRGIIYNNSSATATTYVAQTSEVSIAKNAAKAWVDFNFARGVELTAGDYWIGLMCGTTASNVRFYYIASGDTANWSSSSTSVAYPSYPDPWDGSYTTSFYSIYATYMPLNNNVLGSTKDDFSSNSQPSTNGMWADKHTLSENAYVTKINVLEGGGSGGTTPQRGIIYNDNGGNPGTFKAVTAESILPVNAALGWYSLNFSSPVYLAAGTYWIGIWSGSGNAWVRWEASAGVSNSVSGGGATYASTGDPPSVSWGSNGTNGDAFQAVYTPVNKATITLQEDNGSWGEWSDKVTLVNAEYNTSSTLSTRASFTPTADGRHYRIAASVDSGFYDIYNAKIVVDQTSTVTKLEPQYLLLNTKSTSTGYQNYLTAFDISEWTKVTNTYKHAQDAIGAAANAKLTDVTTVTDLTNSSITGANQQISSEITNMPTATGPPDVIDTNIVNAGTEVSASRILVSVTIPTNYTCQWSATATTTAWATISNWTSCGNEVPSSVDIAEIITSNNNPSITTSVTVGGLTHTSGALTINTGGSLQVNGNITLTSGTFNSNGFAVNLTGNWVNNGGTYTPGASTVTFNGTTAQTINGSSSTDFKNITIANTTGSVSNTTSTSLTGAFTVNANATFAASSSTVTMNQGSSIVNNGSLTFYGLTINGTGFSTTQSFAVGGPFTVNVAKDFTASSNSVVTMNNGSSIVNNNSLTFKHLTIALGATVTSASSFNVTGDWTDIAGVFTASAGTVTFNGTTQNIVVAGGVTTFYNFVLASGTTTTSSSFNIKNNWTNSGGTLAGSGGKVIFNGTGPQVISGNTTFFGLEITTFNARTVTFAGGSTTSIANNGSLTFRGGNSSNRLTLASSDSSDWNLQVSMTGASVSVSGVSVSRSNAGGYRTIVAGASTDGGNNTNWTFSSNNKVIRGGVTIRGGTQL